MIATHQIQTSTIDSDVVGKHRTVEHEGTTVEANSPTNTAFTVVAQELHHPQFHITLEKPESSSISRVDIVINKHLVVVHITACHDHMRILGTDSTSVFPGSVEVQGGVTDLDIVARIDLHSPARHVSRVGGFGIFKHTIVEPHLPCFLHLESIPTAFPRIIDAKACGIGHGESNAIALRALGNK